MEFYCGYVYIPNDHKYFNDFYDDLNEIIKINGGLTYGVDKQGCVGFDFGHAYDFFPGNLSIEFYDSKVWRFEDVKKEVLNLASQLYKLRN